MENHNFYPFLMGTSTINGIYPHILWDLILTDSMWQDLASSQDPPSRFKLKADAGHGVW